MVAQQDVNFLMPDHLNEIRPDLPLDRYLRLDLLPPYQIFMFSYLEALDSCDFTGLELASGTGFHLEDYFTVYIANLANHLDGVPLELVISDENVLNAGLYYAIDDHIQAVVIANHLNLED